MKDNRVIKEYPHVVIIIPVYKNPSGLRRCLDALVAQDYQGRYDITVIENSQAFTLEPFRVDYPRVNFLWEPTPGSYNARNKGLAETDAPILGFTDSDCVPHKNWISEGVRALSENDGIGAVGGPIKVRMLEHNDKPSIAEYLNLMCSFRQDWVLHQGFLPTANLFMTRIVMDKVGIFNGNLKSGGDKEWCLRAGNAGFKIIYDSRVVVDHHARNLEESMDRTRRVLAGMRDMEPGWKDCFAYVFKRKPIPLKSIMSVWQYQDPRCTTMDRIKISLLLTYLRWYESYYRLYLHIFRSPSPR